MTYHSPILSIDDEYPTKEELGVIRQRVCNNCDQPYVYGAELRFVYLSNGTLIWWHTYECDGHKHHEDETDESISE